MINHNDCFCFEVAALRAYLHSNNKAQDRDMAFCNYNDDGGGDDSGKHLEIFFCVTEIKHEWNVRDEAAHLSNPYIKKESHLMRIISRFHFIFHTEQTNECVSEWKPHRIKTFKRIEAQSKLKWRLLEHFYGYKTIKKKKKKKITRKNGKTIIGLCLLAQWAP